MQGELETYEDEAGGWRWRVRAANGEIVIPPESHTRESDARRAFTTAALIAGAVLRGGNVSPLAPSAATLTRLGSIIVHVEEAASHNGHPFDDEAMRALMDDPGVVQWMEDMRKLALLPVRRSTR